MPVEQASTAVAALTRGQRRLYDYLSEHAAEFAHNPPTLDELCARLGLRSRGSLHKHVQGLVKAGLVAPMEGRQRGVRLIRDAVDDEDALPLLGYIAAGRPIEALENPETIGVPPHLRTSRPCYVLQVRGDSMIEDGIFDGDWVVVEQRAYAHNGEIVVALVDGSEATLKRIEQRPGAVILHPANAAMRPLTYRPEQVLIQGVLVGQMRRYS